MKETRPVNCRNMINRRAMLAQATGLAAAGLAALGCPTPLRAAKSGGKAATRGRIKHSVVYWCFGLYGGKWSVDQAARVAHDLGCASVELVAPEHYPTLRRVGSPRMKLLFDVFHVQVMDGDIIRRVHELKDLIGHVHTAGNRGRAELDDRQEINYRAVMQALLDIGYTGYVGQEFIPTRDPLEGLRQAVVLCDV